MGYVNNSKVKGDTSEIAALYNFQLNGVFCSKPYGDNLPYDLIADINKKLYKVQVKTASLSKDKNSFTASLRSSIIGKNKKYSHYTYSDEDVDLFVINCIETNEICLIPKNIASNTSLTIRRNKNCRQTKNIFFLEDYSFEKIIKTLI